MDIYNNYNNRAGLEDVLIADEDVLWRGKPKKTPYCLGRYSKLLPFAIIWLLFDGFFIFMILSTGQLNFALIAFFAFHLLPVWKVLVEILTAKKRWETEEYVVTSRRILIQSGLIGTDYATVYYKDISDVRLDVGLAESFFRVGNIILRINGMGYKSGSSLTMAAIENPKEIYRKVQKIIMDIQTDTYYPNDLRPETNSGYNTKYNG